MRGHTAAHRHVRRQIRGGAAALTGFGLALALAGCAGPAGDEAGPTAGQDVVQDEGARSGTAGEGGTRTPQPLRIDGELAAEDAETPGAGDRRGRQAPDGLAAPPAGGDTAADAADWRAAPDGPLADWAPEHQVAVEQETAEAIHRHLVGFVDGDGFFLGVVVSTEQGGTLSAEQVPGPERASFDEVVLQEAETTQAGEREVRGTVTDADGTEHCLRLRDAGEGLAPVYSGGCPGLLRRPEAPVERTVTAADHPLDDGVVGAVGDLELGGVPWEDVADEDAAPPLRGTYEVTLGEALSAEDFRVADGHGTWSLEGDRPRVTLTDEAVDRAFAHVQDWAAAERSLALDDDPRCEGKVAHLQVGQVTVRTPGTQCGFGGSPTPEVTVGEPQRGDDVRVAFTGGEDGEGGTARVAVGFANEDGTPVLERTVASGHERTPTDISHTQVWVVFDVAEDGTLHLAEEDAIGPFAR
ncbi:hypothetical protein ACSBQY_04180 [Micrococcus lylae]|uniref:hypothetical protein n=1 Tax=Micrococcus lylae TaxID=1273 RepID=UPI003EB8DE14